MNANEHCFDAVVHIHFYDDDIYRMRAVAAR